MAGYRNDYSMSNNAFSAYQYGEMPLSKWTKTAIVAAVEQSVSTGEIDVSTAAWTLEDIHRAPAVSLKCYLRKSSWHHTSSWYNCTKFYELDIERLQLATVSDLMCKPESASNEASPETWKCAFLVWSGTRKHPKASERTEVGQIIGNWFILPDGSKKSISAKGFRRIERVL